MVHSGTPKRVISYPEPGTILKIPLRIGDSNQLQLHPENQIHALWFLFAWPWFVCFPPAFGQQLFRCFDLEGPGGVVLPAREFLVDSKPAERPALERKPGGSHESLMIT